MAPAGAWLSVLVCSGFPGIELRLRDGHGGTLGEAGRAPWQAGAHDRRVVDCLAVTPRPSANRLLAFLYGPPIGALGGLIGLGGAEFRLPVLKAVFKYSTRRAIALNLAVSLVTLVASLVVRLRVSPQGALLPLVPVIAGLIAGSMLGAWLGASYASRISIAQLDRWVFFLLVGIGVLLIVEGSLPWQAGGVPWGLGGRLLLAALVGVGIGLVSSLLGVAGGELIIPTLVFLFGADIKIAGTASVLVSLPTVLVGLARYARLGAFEERSDLGTLVLPMGVGSILGAFLGGILVPYVPAGALKIGLGAILIVSAIPHLPGTTVASPKGLARPMIPMIGNSCN